MAIDQFHPMTEENDKLNIHVSDFVKRHPAKDIIINALYDEERNQTPVIKMSLDDGQGREKAAVEVRTASGKNSYLEYSLPSFMDQQQDRNKALSNVGMNISRNEENTEEDQQPVTIKYNDKYYVFGGHKGTSRLDDRARYLSIHFKIAAMTASRYMLNKLYPGSRHGIIYIVTHVPMDVYEQYKDLLITEHSGHYQFSVIEGKHEVNYDLTIIIINVVPEGTGIAIFAGPNNDNRYGVAEGGNGTTHLMQFVNGVVDADKCWTKNLGVSTIANGVNILLKNRYGRELDEEEMQKALSGYRDFVLNRGYTIDEYELDPKNFTDVQYKDKVDARLKHLVRVMPVAHSVYQGKRIKMDPKEIYLLIRKVSEEVGEEFVSFMRTKWGKEDQGVVGMKLAMMVCAGGIVYFIKPVIEANVPDVSFYPKPEFLNAYGLAIRSKMIYDIAIKENDSEA